MVSWVLEDNHFGLHGGFQLQLLQHLWWLETMFWKNFWKVQLQYKNIHLIQLYNNNGDIWGLFYFA